MIDFGREAEIQEEDSQRSDPKSQLAFIPVDGKQDLVDVNSSPISFNPMYPVAAAQENLPSYRKSQRQL